MAGQTLSGKASDITSVVVPPGNPGNGYSLVHRETRRTIALSGARLALFCEMMMMTTTEDAERVGWVCGAKQRQRSGLARLFCRCLKRQLGNARIGIGLLVSREPFTMIRPREHMR